MKIKDAVGDCLRKLSDTEGNWWIRPVSWKGRAVEIHHGRLWVVPRGSHDIAFHPALDEILEDWEVVLADQVLGEDTNRKVPEENLEDCLMTDWYEENIESGVRDLVRLLRDNGVNTECSCVGHQEGALPYVQCRYVPDGEVKRIQDLLINAGHRNFILRLYHKVADGHPYSTLDIYIGRDEGDVFRKQEELECNEGEVGPDSESEPQVRCVCGDHWDFLWVSTKGHPDHEGCPFCIIEEQASRIAELED